MAPSISSNNHPFGQYAIVATYYYVSTHFRPLGIRNFMFQGKLASHPVLICIYCLGMCTYRHYISISIRTPKLAAWIKQASKILVFPRYIDVKVYDLRSAKPCGLPLYYWLLEFGDFCTLTHAIHELRDLPSPLRMPPWGTTQGMRPAHSVQRCL